jgi:NarL family two-component system response regulator LiaR
MTEGLSNPEMADRLFVSRSTIKFHVSNILSKLGAESRTEAVAIAIHNNLLE